MARRTLAALFALTSVAAPAAARADLFSPVSYGVHASTIGDGIVLERPLLFDFSARVMTGTLSSSQETSYDGQRYTATTRYRNVALIGDFHPYAGRWRLSGGLVFSGDAVENVARLDGPTVTIGRGGYATAAITDVRTKVAYDRPSIYLGAGAGTGIIRGFAFSFDGGILIRNGHASASAAGPLASSAAVQADLERLRGELRTHTVVPMLSAGIIFRP